MDLIEVLYPFAKQVEKALNEGGVAPPGGDYIGAILLMVGNDKDRRIPPLGGSFNYDRKTGKWEWAEQLSQATPIVVEDEQG